MDVFVARQPIFDSKLKVYGYEILYRSSFVNEYSSMAGDEATSRVIIDTFQTFGLANLTNNRPAFINFTGHLIKEEVATLFPHDSLVVEILETVQPDDDVVQKCLALKELGYTIALDDFVFQPGYERLIALADIIKLDFIKSTRRELKIILRMLQNKGIKFLAEKIETRADFKFAQEIGCTLFQGFFFSKPEILTASSLEPLKVNYLLLMSKLNQTEIDFDELAELISRDLSLTYNLLKLVNSAAFGFRTRITSIKQSLVILGEREIRKWVTLIALNGMGQGQPDELVRMSLVRARFAELIAFKCALKDMADDLFLMGLFSLMDVILERPLAEILGEISASRDISAALLASRGPLAGILRMLQSYERGNWEQTHIYAQQLGLASEDLIAAYLESLLWYNTVLAGL